MTVKYRNSKVRAVAQRAPYNACRELASGVLPRQGACPRCGAEGDLDAAEPLRPLGWHEMNECLRANTRPLDIRLARSTLHNHSKGLSTLPHHQFVEPSRHRSTPPRSARLRRQQSLGPSIGKPAKAVRGASEDRIPFHRPRQIRVRARSVSLDRFRCRFRSRKHFRLRPIQQRHQAEARSPYPSSPGASSTCPG